MQSMRASTLLLTALACWSQQPIGCDASFEVFVVGKGQPANMSSSYDSGQNPRLAMDGNTNGTYLAGLQCVHAATGDPLPWWMVDMGQTYFVYGARVWNRLDSSFYYRFTHTSIGVTSNPSVWTTFSTDLLDLCMNWPGVPTAADNPINFTCSTPIAGRYLAVYKNITGLVDDYKPFHFCEVDILAYTKQLPLFFKKTQPSFSSTSTSLLVNASGTAKLDIPCIVQCSVLPDCLFVLLRTASLDCWLFGSAIIPDSFASVYGSSDAKFFAVQEG